MNCASAALICALLGSNLTPIAALAAIIEVPTDYPTIQAAIDNTNPGDEVVVLPGTYVENLSIVFRSSLSIYSQGGPDVTRLDGSYSRPAFRIQNSTMIRIAGFTIERGLIGGEIRGSGQIAIEENRIERNVSPTDGGGLFIVQSSVVVANNIIIDNASNHGLSLDGGGIYLYNLTGSVRANRIQGNRGHKVEVSLSISIKPRT